MPNTTVLMLSETKNYSNLVKTSIFIITRMNLTKKGKNYKLAYNKEGTNTLEH